MPWGNRGFTYNATSISKHAPNVSGVYAIFREGLWIYIGETDNIRSSLQAHINEADRCITRYRPTGFSFELWPAGERIQRYYDLISELSPPCNHVFGAA
jgi:hypothetical protein